MSKKPSAGSKCHEACRGGVVLGGEGQRGAGGGRGEGCSLRALNCSSVSVAEFIGLFGSCGAQGTRQLTTAVDAS